MDTLPQSPSVSPPSSVNTVPVPPPSQGPVGSVAKESEVLHMAPQEMPTLTEVGQEVPLPPDVSHVGVSLHPTTIEIPKVAAQLGVQPVGHTVPAALTPTVVLPLSDEQIAEGLHQSITSSWRWLATWCVRRLKELHVAVRSQGGKIIRESV